MKSWLKIGLVILLLILVVYLVYKFNKPTEKYFKPILLDSTNFVFNYTNQNYLDTIIKVGLSSLDIKNINIMVYPLTSDIKNTLGNGTELQAHIREYNQFQYFIWIDNLSRNESIKVLSHELIHLKQYYTFELQFQNGILIWRNEIIDINKYEYKDRPWEIDAFSKENDLYSTIEKKLY